jgi:hypothetical protein
MHPPQPPALNPETVPFLASGVLGPKNFRQNNFHARKILKKLFYERKKSGQEIFERENFTTRSV